jgi:hypothetical protein
MMKAPDWEMKQLRRGWSPRDFASLVSGMNMVS